MVDAGLPVLKTELHEREAFRAVFSLRQPERLDPADVANIERAIANAEAIAAEVIEILRKAKTATSTEKVMP